MVLSALIALLSPSCLSAGYAPWRRPSWSPYAIIARRVTSTLLSLFIRPCHKRTGPAVPPVLINRFIARRLSRDRLCTPCVWMDCIALPHCFDVVELPPPIEYWLQRAVQPKHREETLAGDRLDPVVFHALRRR